MKDKKTVFVLGAGASCPYGYPFGAHLRKLICLDDGFMKNYKEYLKSNKSGYSIEKVEQFRTSFDKSSIKSIDFFMANNSTLAPVGKYIIAFEVLRAEQRSSFREKGMQSKLWYSRNCDDPKLDRDFLLRKDYFQGGDWYSYLYNRLIEGLIGRDALPDFSTGDIAFVTFNYDRSLEHFFYESLRNSFTEVPEDNIFQSLRNLKILHVYGQIAPLKWQDSNEGVDYRPEISVDLLRRVSSNIRTIYEVQETRELAEAQNLLKQAGEIFFLGFGFAKENMEVLGLPEVISQNCSVYVTVFELRDNEADQIRKRIKTGVKSDTGWQGPLRLEVHNVDCLTLLRDYFG